MGKQDGRRIFSKIHYQRPPLIRSLSSLSKGSGLLLVGHETLGEFRYIGKLDGSGETLGEFRYIGKRDGSGETLGEFLYIDKPPPASAR